MKDKHVPERCVKKLLGSRGGWVGRGGVRPPVNQGH